jgi:hypothetical protein
MRVVRMFAHDVRNGDVILDPNGNHGQRVVVDHSRQSEDRDTSWYLGFHPVGDWGPDAQDGQFFDPGETVQVDLTQTFNL